MPQDYADAQNYMDVNYYAADMLALQYRRSIQPHTELIDGLLKLMQDPRRSESLSPGDLYLEVLCWRDTPSLMHLWRLSKDATKEVLWRAEAWWGGHTEILRFKDTVLEALSQIRQACWVMLLSLGELEDVTLKA